MRSVQRQTDALDRVLEVAVLINEDMTRGLARGGLTYSRTHLLWVLHHRGPITQRVLADALAVSPRTVTGLVDGLVATGFVTREPHPTDRRATLVTFTRQGSRTMAKMGSEREQFAALLFANMGERRFDGLVKGLDEVLDRLRDALTTPAGGQL